MRKNGRGTSSEFLSSLLFETEEWQLVAAQRSIALAHFQASTFSFSFCLFSLWLALSTIYTRPLPILSSAASDQTCRSISNGHIVGLFLNSSIAPPRIFFHPSFVFYLVVATLKIDIVLFFFSLILRICFVIRSSERRAGDVEVIAAYLHKWRCLDSLSNSLLRRLASVAYLEDLDDGVTRNIAKFPQQIWYQLTSFFFNVFHGFWCAIVYRQGDRGTNWYFILSGEIVMATCSDRSDNKDASSSFRHVSSFKDNLFFYFFLLVLPDWSCLLPKGRSIFQSLLFSFVCFASG